MPAARLEVKEIKAKSALVKSNLPEADYVINPYVGCSFGCVYCYASFMGRFVNKKISDWGNYVYPKVNIVEVLKGELGKKLKNKGRSTTVFLSSVTDPYLGLEAKYKLTRGCLEALLEFGFEGLVSILTKSPLVLRDIHVFKKLKHVEVGLTITTTSDKISRYFEKYAPSTSQRLEALQKLNQEGISTYAFIGPIFPHFLEKKAELVELFKEVRRAGTKRIFVEHLNLSRYIRQRLKEIFRHEKGIEKYYLKKLSERERFAFTKLLVSLVKKYNFELLGGGVLYHKDG